MTIDPKLASIEEARDTLTSDAALVAGETPQNADDTAVTPEDGVSNFMREYEALSEKYDIIVACVNERADELKAKGLLSNDTKKASHTPAGSGFHN
jgi:hypothetical protein